jgi:DNA-binding CsgD family transcriptional regulator
MNLHAAPGDKPLHVVVTPLRIADGARNLPVAAVIVRDTESQTEIRPELLQQLYGLTRAEARVVTELARGKRLTEVAQTLNVSVNTVRNQLKQAFAKTSTNRQADLVSLVLTSLSDLAQERERESVA